MARKALGKGLEALMPERTLHTAVQEIDVKSIDPNPHQPRKQIETDSLDGLIRSVRESGVIQPILVRRVRKRYEIIAGERRWRAAVAAGLKSIPAIVRGDLDHGESLLLALVENVQRKDLNAVEEAEAYQAMMREFHLTQEEIASRVGKPRATIANYLRILKLPPKLLKMIVDGELSMGHAKALLALPDASSRMRLAVMTVRKNWTVRQLEQEIQAKKAKTRPTKKDLDDDPDWRYVRTELEKRIGGRVSFRRKGRESIVFQVVFPKWENLDAFYREFCKPKRTRKTIRKKEG